MDSDERVPAELKEEINAIIINPESNTEGYYVKRIDYMWGKQLKHGETSNISFLRLAKRGAGSWVGKVHEKWIIDGKIGELESPLLHFPHPTVNDFLKEINYYSTLRANELYENKVNVSFLSILVYPKAKFFLNYFLKLGFLDGMEGLIFAIMMSFHSFLVRGKLWSLWQKK